jgi:hypothetical protein
MIATATRNDRRPDASYDEEEGSAPLPRSGEEMNRRITRLHRIALVGAAMVSLLAASPIKPAAETLEDGLALYRTAAPTEQRNLRASVDRLLTEGIDEQLLAELLHRAHQYGADAAVTAVILNHAQQIAEQDLPTQSLFDRYLQGMSKGIPIKRIQMVAEEVEHRLGEAARQIDAVYESPDDPQKRQSRHMAIDHAAYAIGAGVSGGIVGRVLQLALEDEAKIEETGSALITIGVLVSGGIDVERSYEIIETGWKHGFRGVNLEHLGRDLGGLGSLGEGSPDEIIDQILDRIRRMETRDRIFRDLDAMYGRIGEGRHPPGSRPGEDPTQMHGPGGPPENPGRQDDRGHHGGGSGR